MVPGMIMGKYIQWIYPITESSIPMRILDNDEERKIDSISLFFD